MTDLAAIERQDSDSDVHAYIAQMFPNGAIKTVLLLSPPDAGRDLFNYQTAKRGRYWNYPPYGLGLLAQGLRQRGIHVEILNLNDEVLKACDASSSEDEFDFNAAWKGPILEAIDANTPDLIGISCMFSQTHTALVEASRFLREIAPGVPQALGGVHVSNSLEDRKTEAGFIADLPWVELFFTKEADRSFQNFIDFVSGDVGSDRLGQMIVSGPEGPLHFEQHLAPGIEDINTMPAHDLLRPDKTSRLGKIGSFYCLKPPETRFATVLSNRGCRAQCTFCSVRSFNGVGVRRRATQLVIDELKLLRDEYGIEHVMWLDDDFLYDRKQSLELFNEMVRQNLNMTWDCSNGVIAASCTEEMMSAAAGSGCIGINIGMESGNRDILRQVKKPGTVKNFLRAAETLRKFESINARVFLIIGFPGETYRQLLDTIEVSQEMDLDWYNVTLLQPLPNTPIFDQMVAEGQIDAVEFEETRFNSGAYGRHRDKNRVGPTDLSAIDFKDAFEVSELDEIPSRARLDDVWAYMNYHLNFRRLLTEDRPTKLAQQTAYVGNIVDIVAPDNAFALYFLGYLQHRRGEDIDQDLVMRLENQLSTSPYWSDRFQDFGLSANHLKLGQFPAGT